MADAIKDEPQPAAQPFHDEELVRVIEVNKSYNSNKSRLDVLKNLDFRLGRGETVAVIGPSGIGKSTLLHILGTLDKPDSGKMLFHGEDVFKFDSERLSDFRNKSIGFVFQFHHLLHEFSAIENVMMPLFIQGAAKSEAKAKAGALLERVGLVDRRYHKVTELSGGEQQRVALARALVGEPDLLLADEPTGNLDKKNSEKVHEMLCDLNRELGMSLVVVTHSPYLAAHMSRHVTLTEGQLVDVNVGETSS